MTDNTASVMTGIKKTVTALLALSIAVAMLLTVTVSCVSEKKTEEKTEDNDNRIIAILSENDEKSLKQFLVRFVKGYQVAQDGKWEYDCSDPLESGNNILSFIVNPPSCADWTLYSDVPEEECFIEKSDDPREWANETYCYYTYDAETVEFIAGEIFNLSKSSIELLTERGESLHLFYKEYDRYYTVLDNTEESFSDVKLKSVGFNGNRYFVEYEVNIFQKTDNADEILSVSGTFKAEMELKTIGDRKYWSLYSFRSVGN